MARPKKVGLEYFPLDCQMDDKILMLEAEHGMEGFGVYIRLLQSCYQFEDGKLDMSIVFRWKTLGKTLGILPENLRKMVDTMLEIDLFDRKTFDEEQKLTSNGIQKRLSKVADLREKERNRKTEADLEEKKEFSTGKPGLSERKSTQKEKERESKKEREKETDSTKSDDDVADATRGASSAQKKVVVSIPVADAPENPPPNPPPKNSVTTPGNGDGRLRTNCLSYNADNPGKYPSDMYKAFLGYWTAPVQNGKKSEIGKEFWEIQGTWSLAGRLANWHKRELDNEQRKQPNAGTPGGKKSADFLRHQQQLEPAKNGYGTL